MKETIHFRNSSEMPRIFELLVEDLRNLCQSSEPVLLTTETTSTLILRCLADRLSSSLRCLLSGIHMFSLLTMIFEEREEESQQINKDKDEKVFKLLKHFMPHKCRLLKFAS